MLTTSSEGVITAWYDPLLSWHGLVAAFIRMRGFLSGCGLSPWSLSICSWPFYLYKVHGPIPSIFDFSGFSAVVTYELLEGQSPLLRLRFLWDPSHAILARPWCSLVSILLASPALFFSWRLLLQVGLLPRGTKRKPVIRRLSQQRHHYLTC